MKTRAVQVLMMMLLSIPVVAQYEKSFDNSYSIENYRRRAEENLALLAGDFRIKERIQINNSGITLFASGTKKPELTLYWGELAKFVDIVENYPYNEMVKQFEFKGLQSWQNVVPLSNWHYYKEFPDSLHNLRVALDPGHFGGNMEESIYEERYAKFRAEDLGTKQDVIFYEADLAMAICLILKESLESKGVSVMITRPYATSALGKPFKKWLKDDFNREASKALKEGTITREMYAQLRDTATTERFVFDNFYKFLEFRKRAEKVAEFRPDVTFAVHLNAKEGAKRFGEKYLPLVEDNYNMAFVPGAFLDGELEKTYQKVDFMRLLVSQDIPNSIRLASLLMEKHTEILGVKPVPKENDIRVLKQNSLATDFDGVYCRNLAITRLIRGPIVYGESLLQDNLETARKLSKKDYEFFHPEIGKLYFPKLCADIARAYEESLLLFIEQNSLIKKGLIARAQENKK